MPKIPKRKPVKNAKTPSKLRRSSLKASKSKLGAFLASEVGELPEAPPRFENTKKPELLLCPNIPKPMHGVAPRVVLGSSWWRKEREAAIASTNSHCEACGVHKDHAKYRQWLEGHELYDIDYKRGRMTYVRTTPLCHFCHNYIHDGRLQALLDKRKIHHGKFAQIIQHGDSVLAAAGLTKPSPRSRDQAIIDSILSGNVAEWGDWRMVVNGEEYPPVYVDFNHWKAAHA